MSVTSVQFIRNMEEVFLNESKAITRNESTSEVMPTQITFYGTLPRLCRFKCTAQKAAQSKVNTLTGVRGLLDSRKVRSLGRNTVLRLYHNDGARVPHHRRTAEQARIITMSGKVAVEIIQLLDRAAEEGMSHFERFLNIFVHCRFSTAYRNVA